MTSASIGSIRGKIRQRLAAVLSWRPVSRRQAWAGAASLLVFAAIGLAFTPAARAFDLGQDVVIPAVGFIVDILVSFLGQIMLLAVGVLINVAQYNSFVSSPIVGTGWVIVRDVVNMFFIVVLLVLAFGTILGVQSYSIKGGNLTRLLIMAIVINFSRTLCGLMIDFAQVVMLTFVSGFKDAAGGNFVEAMQINDILQGAQSGGAQVSTSAVVMSLILALVMTAIATFVVVMMTVALTIRIVYLWLLIILSPIAFFLKAVPGGQASKAYADWWSKFTSNLLFGPVLAFFLWLTLVMVQQAALGSGFATGGTGETISDAPSAAFNSQSLQTFIIAVCLLVGGYQMAMELGGSTTGMANKAVKKAAGEFTKRSGIDSYLAQRRSAREEKYAQRGAAIGKGVGAVQLATGKVLGAPGGVLGKGTRALGQWSLARGGGRLSRGIAAAGQSIQQRGVVGAVAAAPGQGIKRLGEALTKVSAAKEGEGTIKRAVKALGRGVGVGTAAVGGVTARAAVGAAKIVNPATIVAESGRADYNRSRDYKYKKVQQDMAGLANRKDGEVKDLAEGKVTGAKASEQQAAILKLMDKGYTNTPELVAENRRRLEDTGADAATIESFDRMTREKFPAMAPPAGSFELAKAQSTGTLDVTKMTAEQIKQAAGKVGSIAASADKRKSQENIIRQSPETLKPYLDGLRTFLTKKEPDYPPGATPGAKNQIKMDFEQKQADARGSLARLDPKEGARDAYGIENGQFVGDAQTQEANMAKFAKDMSRPGAQEAMLNIPAGQIMSDGQVTAVGQAMIQAMDKANNKSLSAAPGVADRTSEQDSALAAIVQAVQQKGTDAQQTLVRKNRSFAGIGGGQGAEDEGSAARAGKKEKAAPPAQPAAPVATEAAVAAAAAPAPKKEDEKSPILTAKGEQQPSAAAQRATAAATPAGQNAELAAVTASLKALESAFEESRKTGQPVVVQGQKMDTKTIENKLSEANRKYDQMNEALKEANKPPRPT